MQIHRALMPAIVLLAACTDSTTTPSTDSALTPAGAPAFERGATITCSASATTGGWSETVQWDHAGVRNVTITTEAGSVTTALDHLRRKGSVSFFTTSQPLGFVLDNGKTTIASGGCAAP
jgi:hypothetical protein